MIGGPQDGKWVTKQSSNTSMRFMKPPKLTLERVQTGDPLAVPEIEYEEYWLERLALWGNGVWVGYHADTMRDLDENGPWNGRDSRTQMALKAILQRDVAAEMGL